MTFLSKLGQFLLKGVALVTGLEPLLQPVLGSKAAPVDTAINDFTQMAGVTIQIETAFGAVQGSTGAQKLQALVPLIANIVKTSEVVAGKKIANEALFTKACAEYAQATVDLLDSINPDEVKQA